MQMNSVILKAFAEEVQKVAASGLSAKIPKPSTNPIGMARYTSASPSKSPVTGAAGGSIASTAPKLPQPVGRTSVTAISSPLPPPVVR